MAGTIDEVEKNTKESFSYVKKDLMMLNDAVSEIYGKIQKLTERLDVLEECASGIKAEKTSKKNKTD